MHKLKNWLGVSLLAGVGAMALLLLGTLLPGNATAVSAALPSLPPRPTPETEIVGDAGETGGFIEVVIPDAPDGAWTVVEWQDGEGAWHEVTGWREGLDDVDSKRWWVAPDVFGTGPYRWMIYDGPNGVLLAESATFDMPAQAGELVRSVVLTNLE